MKIVPPSSFADTCTCTVDIESENKTSKAKRHGSANESSEERGDESKTIQALRKDMMRLMKYVTISVVIVFKTVGL